MGCEEEQAARWRGGEVEQTARLFSGGVYSSPFLPTQHISNLLPPLAPSSLALFSGPRIFSSAGPIQVLATPLQSSYCPLHYVKNCFFFGRHFLIFACSVFRSSYLLTSWSNSGISRHHCNRLVVLYIMSKIVFFFVAIF